MPIYEYECAKCKKRCEILVRSSDPHMECPHCKSTKLKRLISAFAFASKDAKGNITTSSASGCSGCSGGDCSSCGS